MKIRLTIFFLSLLFISCKKEKIDNPIESKLPEREVLIDTTDGEQFIAILQLEDSKKSINLSKDEIKTVEVLLRKSVENYNENFEKNYIDLRYYKRQYFPQIDENGDKLVGIYCFCSVEDNDKWKTQELINPQDGGKCYLHATINVTKKTVTFFQTNGRA
ncbi:hypothetical protein [Flavobacterium sp. WC2509]|uniref:hypothetical protein n=1 Tax=Flavobacterium sp. WC2509 TaxID=3461406 RepID=UPI0040451173